MLSREIDAGTSTRILVQYVPHAFGWKGQSPFCLCCGFDGAIARG